MESVTGDSVPGAMAVEETRRGHDGELITDQITEFGGSSADDDLEGGFDTESQYGLNYTDYGEGTLVFSQKQQTQNPTYGSQTLTAAAIAAASQTTNTVDETRFKRPYSRSVQGSRPPVSTGKNYVRSYYGGQGPRNFNQNGPANPGAESAPNNGFDVNAHLRNQKELERKQQAEVTLKAQEITLRKRKKQEHLEQKVVQQENELKKLREEKHEAQHEALYEEMKRLGALNKVTICKLILTDRRRACVHFVDLIKYVWADAFGNLQRPDHFDEMFGSHDATFQDPIKSNLASNCCLFMAVLLISCVLAFFVWRFVVVRTIGDEIQIPHTLPSWSAKDAYTASRMVCDRITQQQFKEQRLHNQQANQYITFARLKTGMHEIIRRSTAQLSGIVGVHLNVLLNWCVLVLHTQDGSTVTMFNPELTNKSSTTSYSSESSIFCMDGAAVQVDRPDSVQVDYYTTEGKLMQKIYKGADARTLVHLVEQLQGKCPCA